MRSLYFDKFLGFTIFGRWAESVPQTSVNLHINDFMI